MDALTIVIPGQPVPQPRPRFAGGKFPRAYTPNGHPITAYRLAVTLAATVAARGEWRLTDGPVRVDILAVFARPPSHLRADGTPKPGAAAFPPRCDWDNLGKGICDAITDSKVIWVDDDQVVDGRVRKRYAFAGGLARTFVVIKRVDP
jgi:Holliday junction resolvase RusA-like endonuclease